MGQAPVSFTLFWYSSNSVRASSVIFCALVTSVAALSSNVKRGDGTPLSHFRHNGAFSVRRRGRNGVHRSSLGKQSPHSIPPSPFLRSGYFEDLGGTRAAHYSC
ncbi:hypothetical protein CDAR_258771 [Caerostris darwini]|uniref:Secreted protein n=1 Tax=Caerostris darwini TaxID=1538125 RepID=A0AAV4U876_9ARAC|nr:hypothetical protein CDAR_258771 [Caerostris darwini]